jgi:hypothetical protein
MDTLELRNHYAMMTGDTKGAYAVREDDKEGYLYSDEMLRRALEARIELPYDRDVPIMDQSIREYGPQKGPAFAAMGLMNSPARSYEMTTEFLQEANRQRKNDDYMGMLESLGSAARPALSNSPAVRYGSLFGLIDLLMGQSRE